MTLGACFLKGRLPYEKKAPFKIPSVVVIFTVIYWPRLTTDVGSLELICPAKGDAIPYVTPFLMCFIYPRHGHQALPLSKH